MTISRYKLLPGTGRETIRRMVEGGVLLHYGCVAGHAPSTSFAGPPPRAGEDWL